MKRQALLLLLVLPALCAAGCDRAARWEVHPVPTPAPRGALYPSVSAGGGEAWISWLEEPEDGAPALRVARRADGAWDETRTVREDPALLVNWADFPSITRLDDGSLAVQWLVRPARGLGYGARVAFSVDAGVTWSEPQRVHDDDDAGSEHGFVTLVPGGGDRVASAWLDGRAVGGGGEMQLRGRDWTGGLPGEERLLDGDVCTCCNTDGAAVDGETLFAYRDHTAGEIRDIRVTDARGTRTASVHDDGWSIAACPVNGPGLAAAAGRVVAAWYTEAEPEPRVLIAFSDDGGRTFGEPVRIDDGRPVGRVDVAAFADGEIVAVWVERAARAGEVRWRRVGADGKLHASSVLGPTRIDRSAGFPRVAVDGAVAYVVWRRPPHPWELGMVEITR